jgi:hypothetical protein
MPTDQQMSDIKNFNQSGQTDIKDNLHQKIDLSKIEGEIQGLNKNIQNLSLKEQEQEAFKGTQETRKQGQLGTQQPKETTQAHMGQQEKIGHPDWQAKQEQQAQQGLKDQSKDQNLSTKGGEQTNLPKKQEFKEDTLQQTGQQGELQEQQDTQPQQEEHHEGLWDKAKHFVSEIKDTIVEGANLVGETLKEIVYVPPHGEQQQQEENIDQDIQPKQDEPFQETKNTQLQDKDKAEGAQQISDNEHQHADIDRDLSTDPNFDINKAWKETVKEPSVDVVGIQHDTQDQQIIQDAQQTNQQCVGDTNTQEQCESHVNKNFPSYTGDTALKNSQNIPSTSSTRNQ